MPEKIAEGKTKIIWQGDFDGQVEIESKDVITAGDGDKKDDFPGKAALSTTTTCNIFELLNRAGIRTHFIEQRGPRKFLAHALTMKPVECVARRILKGSYLLRNPETVSGTIVDELVVEFFWKDDKNHDPYMLWNEERGCFELYKPKEPIGPDSYLGDLPEEQARKHGLDQTEIREQLAALTPLIFLVIETAWAKLGLIIADFKVEFGIDSEGKIRLGDVIDADSFRGEFEGKEMSKQVYRDGGDLSEVAQKFTWVANTSHELIA